MQDMKSLVLEMCKLPTEESWVEFKHNNYDPDMIGKDVSAIANAVALEKRSAGYMIWGVHNLTHEVVGTEYDLQKLKKGNEELENWLRHQMSENADFTQYKTDVNGFNVVVLQIAPAVSNPVTFSGSAYIRIGSLTKRLQSYPAVEAQLWRILAGSVFELQSAATDLVPSEIQELIDVSAYFERCRIPRPVEFLNALRYMEEEGLVVRQDNARYMVTNLAALLFARRLSAFPTLRGKFFRVARHDGDSRLEMLQDRDFTKGYAYAFEEGLMYIMSVMRTGEPIVGSSRKVWTAVPEKAVREALANMLVHREMSNDSTDALVEVFDSRIELTNPGRLLVDPMRIIDNPPRARNPRLAELMRRMHFCEASGSGWDKIVASCEAEHLPSPRIDQYPDSVKVTLYAEKPYGKMAHDDKILAVYYHACIMHMAGQRMTNSSLRQRFGLKENDAGNLSRLVKDAVGEGLVKPYNPESSRKYMSYVPYWC